MKKFWKVSGKKHEIKFESDNANSWKISTRPGGWIIAEKNGQKIRIQYFHNSRWQSVAMGGRLWSGEIIRHSHGSGASQAGSDADLTAQFPGKVRKILVQAGDFVKTGQPLILVEAMKMEFEIKAPAPGKIRQVKVSAGQQLAPGDRFFEFEEIKE